MRAAHGRRDADPGRGARRAGARRGASRSSARDEGRGAGRDRATSRRSRTSPTTARRATRCSTADFVTTDDGTGVVHTAVAFGEDDFQLGERYGLTVQNPVRPDGTFDERIEPFAGPLREGGRPRHRQGARASRAGCSAPRGTSTPTRTAGAATRRSSTTRRRRWYVKTTAVQRRAARRERGGQLVPRPHQARPHGQLARGQRRLGAVARALLGHAAAGLALHGDGSTCTASARAPSCAELGAAAARATCTGRTSTTSRSRAPTAAPRCAACPS